jgi:hypothetical protein
MASLDGIIHSTTQLLSLLLLHLIAFIASAMQERSVYSIVQCTIRWYQNIMSKTTKNPNFQRQAMLEMKNFLEANQCNPNQDQYCFSFVLFPLGKWKRIGFPIENIHPE